MGSKRYDRYMEEEYEKYISQGGDDVPLPGDEIEPVTEEEREKWGKLADEWLEKNDPDDTWLDGYYEKEETDG